jgi:hypothetical protein
MAKAAIITNGFKWNKPINTINSEIKPLVPGTAAFARVNKKNN